MKTIMFHKRQNVEKSTYNLPELVSAFNKVSEYKMNNKQLVYSNMLAIYHGLKNV